MPSSTANQKSTSFRLRSWYSPKFPFEFVIVNCSRLASVRFWSRFFYKLRFPSRSRRQDLFRNDSQDLRVRPISSRATGPQSQNWTGLGSIRLTNDAMKGRFGATVRARYCEKCNNTAGGIRRSTVKRILTTLITLELARWLSEWSTFNFIHQKFQQTFELF